MSSDDFYEFNLYNHILNDVVTPYIGNSEITDSKQLDECCHHFLDDTDYKFLGVFSSDRIPKLINMNEFCIVNLDPSYKPGSHWVSFSSDLFYDSFGRPLNTLLDRNNNLMKIKDTDLDPEQEIKENNCGQRSIAWILCYAFFGKEIAKKI